MTANASPAPSTAVDHRQALALLALVVALFGTAWPAMKTGLLDATPVWYAAARAYLSAATAFALLALLGKLALPRRSDWPIVFSVGTGQLAGFFMLVNLGLGMVPAGRGSVLAYTTSIWLVPIGILALGERLDRWRAAGLVLGLAGMAVLFNPAALDWSDGGVLLGNLSLLGAALTWSIAILHARTYRWPRLSPLQVVPWQMSWAALLLTVFAAIVEPEGRIGLSTTSLIPLAYISIVVGPVATWAAMSVSRALPTIVSSLGFLAVPAVGILSSALVLGEPVTGSLAAGAGLIIGGAALVSLSTFRSGAAK